MKKPHLLPALDRFAQTYWKYASTHRFIARLACGIFWIGLLLAFVKSHIKIRNARSAAALGCRPDLTDTGKRKAHRADNDGREQNQNHSQSRYLRNPTTAPKLPDHSRNHNIATGQKRQ